jgi:hypothetical protein
MRSSDKSFVSILLAKRRTLHIFSDNGKSIPVSLRERDGSVAVFESREPIPVGVDVSWLNNEEGSSGTVLQRRPAPNPMENESLLEISVEFQP